MMTLAPVPAVAIIAVRPAPSGWRLTSSDALFSGLFVDRRAAVRHALAEADCHPGHVVVVREAADLSP
jgi:hypothetical protein